MGAMAKMLGMGGAGPNAQGPNAQSMAEMAEMAKKMGAGPGGANPLTGLNPALDLEKLKNLGGGKLPGLGTPPSSSGLFGGLPGLPGSKPFDPTKK